MSQATALIAEDEPLLAQALAAELARLWPELQIVAQAGDGPQAISEALASLPQICFLDIRMPGADGLEVARALAEEWPAQTPFPLLVFVTAYDQYAVQAFERQAIDYLLKPLEVVRLAQCVARLRRELERPSAAPADQLAASIDQLRDLLTRDLPNPSSSPPVRLEVIQAGVAETLHMVPVDEVIYFEAADKYVRLLTTEREHLIRLSLRELLPQLDPQRFWQIHRGTVVQARRIATAERQESGRIVLTLRGRPEKLAVSRLYAHLFKGM